MKDFGQSAATVSFICLKLSFTYIDYLCSGFSPLAVSFCSYLPFHLDDMLLAEGFCAKGFFIIRLAFCGLSSCAVFAECCRFMLSFCVQFFFRLLKWLLFWAWASVSHSFFTPWCFFSPCFFHYVTPLFLQCILGTRKWSQMPRMR